MAIRHSVIPILILTVSTLSTATDADDAQLGEASVQSRDDSAEIQQILEYLAACRDEIVSAEIHYRWHISTYRNPENTAERVRALLQEADLIGDPDSIEGLVDALGPFPIPTSELWQTRDFVMLGDKRRADTSRGAVQLVDSDHEMTYSHINRQLDISNRGDSHVHKTQIEDFRSFPPSQLTADRLRLASHEHGLITLAVRPLEDDSRDGLSSSASHATDSPIAEYSFDESTRIMTHQLRFHHGDVYEEIWQKALNEYSGGVTLPTLRIDTLYNKGALKSLTVWLIENARLNGPINEEQFVMTVPENTVIVDKRLKEEAVRKIKRPVDDVRSILVPVIASNSEELHHGGLEWRWILIMNGIALIGLSVWLWSRGNVSTR